ncbi:hypothetical protein [Paracidobacterium acidisoli]|uniref:Uncharacterized protein n=1 Tax=Paracidobacterium acidisoli TaxID=2303751 RepID=A0A372IQL4_9BACT|nr:hypothetical protein [Paracidobacterium acidisoli]MBT9331132.1 hypothetical protein [Paracidobacterium acidisoli]
MRSGRHAGRRRSALITLFMAAGLCVAAAQPQKNAAAAVPDLQPTTRIPVEPLGFMPQGGFYMSYRLSSASLGFLDNDHLLFTFRPGGLMKRLPGDEDGDEDQDIRAVVLDIATGKAGQPAEWRMHDRSRYMWPVAGGEFLIRMRNSLFLTDSSLRLRPWLNLPEDLRAVQISPDGTTLALEMNEPAPPASQNTVLGDKPAAPEKKIKIIIVPVGSHDAEAASETHNPVMLPMIPGGLLETLEGKKADTWAIRSVLFRGDPKIVAEVQSRCQPTLNPVSATVTLVVGCYQSLGDQHVVALSADGHQLWEQRWQARYVWPTFDFARNGSRFVYSTLDLGRPIGTMDPFDSTDVKAQMVGVFDTATGKLALVRNASPVMSAGQNYALSADGRRFAILRDDAIEIYDLPPVAEPAPGPAAQTQASKQGSGKK